MATKIFVGSLSWDTKDDQLKDLFSSMGEVSSATVVKDRNSGQSKGFGFVEMPNDEEAKAAIKQLNGKELDGRNLNVNEAKPREDRPQNSYRQDNRGNFNKKRY